MSRSHERHRSIRRVLEGGVYVSERVVNSAAGNVSLGHSTLRLLESLDRMRTKPLDRDFGCRKEAIVLDCLDKVSHGLVGAIRAPMQRRVQSYLH